MSRTIPVWILVLILLGCAGGDPVPEDPPGTEERNADSEADVELGMEAEELDTDAEDEHDATKCLVDRCDHPDCIRAEGGDPDFEEDTDPDFEEDTDPDFEESDDLDEES